MSKITLRYEGVVLREFAVDSDVTIGRRPDNAIVVDHAAVSGHHARVYRAGGRVILEDLDSTNGTFVNGRSVRRHALEHGDRVIVGRHELVFDGADARPGPGARRVAVEAGAGASGSRGPRRIGVLRVVSGPAEHPEYELDAQTSLIGRSGTALVRLQGWLKPSVAVSIARTDDGYVATRVGGRPQINDKPLSGRHRLRDGDLLQIGGLALEFAWKAPARAETAA